MVCPQATRRKWKRANSSYGDKFSQRVLSSAANSMTNRLFGGHQVRRVRRMELYPCCTKSTSRWVNGFIEVQFEICEERNGPGVDAAFQFSDIAAWARDGACRARGVDESPHHAYFQGQRCVPGQTGVKEATNTIGSLILCNKDQTACLSWNSPHSIKRVG